jgi:hypothetical protein
MEKAPSTHWIGGLDPVWTLYNEVKNNTAPNWEMYSSCAAHILVIISRWFRVTAITNLKTKQQKICQYNNNHLKTRAEPTLKASCVSNVFLTMANVEYDTGIMFSAGFCMVEEWIKKCPEVPSVNIG